MDLLKKAKGFLADPVKEFESSKEEPLEEALKYYLFIAAVFSLLSAIMTFIIYSTVSSMVNQNLPMLSLPSRGFSELFSDFFMSFILMLICVFIWGALLHAMAYILGGRWEISRTIKVAMYSSTPLIIMGWIPMLGIFGWIWVGALDVVGLHQYQDLPAGKAIAAVIIPIILLIILTIALLVVAVTIIVPMVMEGISV
ncbi:MAG: Yip1 family protein [Candidatus Methanoperedens sp.]|nr:Yip1 family protein [Candidatus Methanoperedens sp.]